LVAFDDDLVEVAGFGGVEGAQREVVDLSRYRDKSTYPDTAIIPKCAWAEAGVVEALRV
jgi:hypothetical protein